MDDIDITAWTGKPPPRRISHQTARQEDDFTKDTPSGTSPTPPGQARSPNTIHGYGPELGTSTLDVIDLAEEEENEESTDSLGAITPRLRTGLLITLPKIPTAEQDEYQYLPGHFHAVRILSVHKTGWYRVELGSGEIDLVSEAQLPKLENGRKVLQDFRNTSVSDRGRRNQSKPDNIGMVSWNSLVFSDTDSDDFGRRSKRRRIGEDEESVQEQSAMSTENDEDIDEETPESISRRSARLTRRKRSRYFQPEGGDQLGSNGDAITRTRRSTRALASVSKRSSRLQKGKKSQSHSSEESELFMIGRRSERTRTKPRQNMRERQEDDISSQSEKEDVEPKIVSTKEYFSYVSEGDPYRKRHRPECDTCGYKGDSREKGPLVFCQGCTNSHHKVCLGGRGTRDHLVTKVGERLFVLQCRRCIGVSHEKDHTAPHSGYCSACNEPGPLTKPLRGRLTTRQEQLQREENGGLDPVTTVMPSLLNNIDNVMFRCATCQRSWHMHHLPDRKTAGSHPEEEEEDEVLDLQELARRRFEHYHRSWICKDCIENSHQIDTIVAWRPVDIDAYIPGTTVEMLEENQKEYLIKWKAQSYLRVIWMPGTWVWGIVAPASRLAFSKRTENKLPKMTTKDAVPEEFFRVDIIFDVRYTSVVRNSSKEIDLARMREVDSAYVKYRGLGYEDAIWEKPPPITDTERWSDFREAYNDYVAKCYMTNPSRTTLTRKLADARSQDFGSTLIKKQQASIVTGGELMQYQMEGHNWLYYQWYRMHNAILADEMGLGKTIQLIAFFATLIQEHKCWPFLVVVPNSTCPNWRREIKKWVPSLRVVTYYGSAIARKLTHDYELFPKDKENDDYQSSSHKKRSGEVKEIKAHIVVASYESISEEKTRQSLMRVPWQGLVVDEGQRLKNDKNLVYESLSKFKFPFKVLLTGTPLQNNARELFNLLQFLDRDKHNAAELEAQFAELTQENVPKLHELLKPYFLRRTKVQVLTFLPPMAQIIVPLSMSALQKKLYKSILSQNPQLMKSIFSRDIVNAKERGSLNNILMQLRKTLCHPFVYSRSIEERHTDGALSYQNLVEASAKLKLLSIMLPKLQERGHRVLLFSQFLDNLDIIEDFLDGMGMLHRRLDGNVGSLEKQKRIDEFNALDSPYFAFLLSTRAGGVGINLATADTVIILDPDFNPHQDIQALSRAHRIGQKHKVLVFQLMTRGSAEEKIMQIGKKKMALDHVLIESMDQGDEAGMDLESILKHGAEALFEDDGTTDIIYDSVSVDNLLDRSQMESTKMSEDKSAESQFSFARIWANDKATLEEGLDESGQVSTSTGIWDKILQEREHAFAEEQARKAEQLGRGKRRRGNVDYGVHEEAAEQDMPDSPVRHRNDANSSDEEFEAVEPEVDEPFERESSPEMRTVKARPFKRITIPEGQAPYFNDVGVSDYIPQNLPFPTKCSACQEFHIMGHGRTCPHLTNEKQVETLLNTLKESTESRELIEKATNYLRMIRGDMMSQRRAREKKMLEAQNLAHQRSGVVNGVFGVNKGH